jgi:hypothetical protein
VSGENPQRDMAILEAMGELIIEIFFESVILEIPAKIYRRVTGRNTESSDYNTEARKFIRFSAAKKFYLVWETDIENLEEKLGAGLNACRGKIKASDFQFTVVDKKTFVQPPPSISFHTFHFLVQWLEQYRYTTVAIVETPWTAYTAYCDPNSENLIGQTSRDKKFFISLTEKYSKRQFLRLNRSIKTIDGFNVEQMREELRNLLASPAPGLRRPGMPANIEG